MEGNFEMKEPTLKYIWIDGEGCIRLDWSNDRHHAVKIGMPPNKTKVYIALMKIGRLIRSDKNLDQKGPRLFLFNGGKNEFSNRR